MSGFTGSPISERLDVKEILLKLVLDVVSKAGSPPISEKFMALVAFPPIFAPEHHQNFLIFHCYASLRWIWPPPCNSGK